MLRRGGTEALRTEDRIEDVRREALSLVAGASGLPASTVNAFWAALNEDYFLRHDAENVAWHVNEIAGVSALDLPLVSVRQDARLGANVFLIYAPESEHLLTYVTAGFERAKLNIVDAKIHTTLLGFALYTFVALEENADQRTTREHVTALRGRLRDLIVNPDADHEPRPVKLSRTMKHFPIRTKVTISDSRSGGHTVMEVVAQDQPGLLHRVARCLSDCKVRLLTAKIATFGERAEDVFFITDRDGNPVTGQEQRRCLESRIHERLDIVAQSESEAKVAHG